VAVHEIGIETAGLASERQVEEVVVLVQTANAEEEVEPDQIESVVEVVDLVRHLKFVVGEEEEVVVVEPVQTESAEVEEDCRLVEEE